MYPEQRHKPVLLAEAITALLANRDGQYVDGTFGRGGHSRAVLARLSTKGRLWAFDKDPAAIAVGQALAHQDSRFTIYPGSFTQMQARLGTVLVDGVLLDLGVSSPQLDTPERGFSFSQDGPLDMRMDPTQGARAMDWLATASEQKISEVLWHYGEERFARRIARAIVRERGLAPITTTKRLATIAAGANPKWELGKHPATRTFQAIRIHINRELADLQDGLAQALEQLKPGGRLVVISFHSLEDRIAKQFIRQQVRGDHLPTWLPVTEAQLNKRLRAVGKAIRPRTQEIQVNPRARSAVMRIAEKLG